MLNFGCLRKRRGSSGSLHPIEKVEINISFNFVWFVGNAFFPQQKMA